jgi:hypothetical protein
MTEEGTMRRFRWWLSELLERWSYAVAPEMDYVDFSELIEHIEPTSTPFLDRHR